MRFLLANLILFFTIFPSLASAQMDSLALTVTPPLININLTPKQEVATEISVVNNNGRPIKVYIEVVDFQDRGNGVEFLQDPSIKNDPGAENIFMSRWVTLTRTEVDLPPYRSEKIPFVISVPEGANPGGHYAALLIGTNPPDVDGQGSVVKVSSKISCLILARVEGEVDERGAIREFSPERGLSGNAENNFKVRFENLGNIHLRPQGTVKVTDMFGKQKGAVVEFNNKKDYGNVLPGGDREWNLSWKDEDFFVFNRYKADLSVSFGQEAIQTDNRFTYFWAVDWKWLSIFLISLAVFVVLLLIVVKAYVRQSVKSLQREMGVSESPVKRPVRRRTIAKRAPTVDLRKKK
jgi:hypothetical protein